MKLPSAKAIVNQSSFKERMTYAYKNSYILLNDEEISFLKSIRKNPPKFWTPQARDLVRLSGKVDNFFEIIFKVPRSIQKTDDFVMDAITAIKKVIDNFDEKKEGELGYMVWYKKTLKTLEALASQE